MIKSLAHIIIATMLLITLPSMLYAETAYAEAQINVTEQSEDLFADIGGTPLTDEQADAIEGNIVIPSFLGYFIFGFIATFGAYVAGRKV